VTLVLKFASDKFLLYFELSIMKIQLQNITKDYQLNNITQQILRGLDITIESGSMVGIVGSSGSGKSTLLHIAGLLDSDYGGDVIIDGQSTRQLSDKQKTSIRLDDIGYIYQFHQLLPEFSAVENVAVAARLAGVSAKQANEKAKYYLDQLELSHRFDHRPSYLSGGEQQRVAIARALMNEPRFILADEPTGSLDYENGKNIFSIMHNLAEKLNLSLLVATHNLELLTYFDQVYRIKAGVCSIENRP
jgi:lipoprotein-releasing system ATP-binding protein